MWVRVALSISMILVLVCSLPIVTPSAVIFEYVKPLQLETCCILAVTSVPALTREGDGFD